MRKIYLIGWLLAIAATSMAQLPNPFRNFKMSDAGSVFTTNSFTSIAVGARNNIWAGTAYGGLYRYSPQLDLWVKSGKLTNVLITDIKMDGDSSIWIAQAGTRNAGGVATNLAGGINRLRKGYDEDSQFEFYTNAGTVTGGDIQSRNMRSLWVDTTFKEKNGQLPKVWAASSFYLTSGGERKSGALSIGLNANKPSFTNVYDSLTITSNSSPICEAIGGGSGEVWMTTRANGGKAKIIIYNMSGRAKDAISTLPELPSNFLVQAIHVDRFGNRWLGLKYGGLVVKTPGSLGWRAINNPVFFPEGTQVNFNAINSDEYGNVFIGTTSGLLEFKSELFNPGADPARSSDYILYTTANGLASNNITGITYDKLNNIVWLTSDAGVTAFSRYQEHIKGVVSDVYTGIDNSSDTVKAPPYAGLQRKPLQGFLHAILLEDGVEIERITPDAHGIFELKKSEENKIYTVEVQYTNVHGMRMVQRFANIKKHTLMQPILMPDSLLNEIKAIKPLLKDKCFDIELFSGLFKHKACKEGFNISSVEDMADDFYKPEGIDKDHEKMVNNLADYYLSLATVYKLGGTATSLFIEGTNNILDMVESLKDLAGISGAFKGLKTTPSGPPEINLLDPTLREGGLAKEAAKETEKAWVGFMKVYVEGLEAALKQVAELLDNKETKELALKMIGVLKDVQSLAVEYIGAQLESNEGGKAALLKFMLDNLKKEFAIQVGGLYYTYYSQQKYAGFIPSAVAAAKDLRSQKSYVEAFDKLCNPEAATPSLVKQGSELSSTRGKTVESLKTSAKYADIGATVSDVGTAALLATGNAPAAAIAKAIGYLAKAAKTSFLASAAGVAWYGADEIADLSEQILPEAGLQALVIQNGMQQHGQINTEVITNLMQKKDAYKQALANMLPVYSAPANAASYISNLRNLNQADSVYTAEMAKVLNQIWAATPDARVKIPAFTHNLQMTVDSFITQQYTLRGALACQNLAYAIKTNDAEVVTEINTLANQIARLNDSALNRLSGLATSINNNNVSIPAYLEQENYVVNHSHQLKTAGSFTYTFRNYGTQPLANVKFSISDPKAGYTITSAKTVSIASIAAGEAKQVTFNFQSPDTDSLGMYELSISADNYRHRTIMGALYAIDPTVVYSVQNGNWSNPATWNTYTVPDSNKGVLIGHEVKVDVDAASKSVKTVYPAKVTINNGKKMTVKQP